MMFGSKKPTPNPGALSSSLAMRQILQRTVDIIKSVKPEPVTTPVLAPEDDESFDEAPVRELVIKVAQANGQKLEPERAVFPPASPVKKEPIKALQTSEIMMKARNLPQSEEKIMKRGASAVKKATSKMLSVVTQTVALKKELNLTRILSNSNSEAILTGVKLYKFAITSGNNSDVVRRAMKTRPWWSEQPPTEMPNKLHFMWWPVSRPIKFDRLDTSPQLVNHFEFHAEITTKTALLKNLHSYCERTRSQLGKITPATVIIDLASEDLETDLAGFVTLFKCYADPGMPLEVPARFCEAKYRLSAIQTKPGDPKNKALMSTTIQESQFPVEILNKYQKNLWLLKPSGYNRGQGIQLFNDLGTLREYINSQLALVAGERAGVPSIISRSNTLSSVSSNGRLSSVSKTPSNTSTTTTTTQVKSVQLVLQKYIESPYLINGRKFDMRVWAFVNYDMSLYFFKEGYIRTSSEMFSLGEGQLLNKYVHLTNNAVQKNSAKYGKFESGNQLSFKAFDHYIKEHDPSGDFYGNMLPRIKELIKISMTSVKSKLNREDREHCFEIYGYDFIIDSQFNVWLIEVNTNPCLEESSPLLQRLIPRMINDALKLNVDVLFPPPNGKGTRTGMFPVEEYSDADNMWELLEVFKLPRYN